jgi:large subunit ribosomal protein L4
MELVLATSGGTGRTKIDVSASTFGRDFNEALVHQVITAYMAGGRAGTRAQKTRAEVRGGGCKPWRQKGTGNARAGTIRSPLWRKGGIIFAAKPQDFTQKVNRKMYRGAMRAILSELVRLQRLIVIKDADMALAEPKTKKLLEQLATFGIQDALVVVKDWNTNLYLSARNLSKVEVCEVSKLDPVSLIKHQNVIITENAIRQIEEVLGER